MGAPAKVADKPSFEECYPEIARIVATRRPDWTYVSVMPYDDVAQELFLRISTKWHLYNPAKAPKLEHWVNTLITNAFFNLRRDVRRFARPCINSDKNSGRYCSYNLGGDACAYTASKIQCNECPLYAEWAKKRQHQMHSQSYVALENHAQEVSNIQGDFTDAGPIKEWLDEQMLKELNRWEGKVYRALWIRNMTPAETSAWLIKEAAQRKRPLGPNEPASYQACLTYRREFEQMMKAFLRRAGHIS